MSELLPEPVAARFPELSGGERWVRRVPAATHLARVFRAAGEHPVEWFDFRRFGPLDARFDAHPEPTGDHPGFGVMYAVLEQAGGGDGIESAFAACLLEVFQQHSIIRRAAGSPTFAVFRIERELRLLDLSDSDWVTVAGGNAAIASGDRSRSRAWARAIRERYPDIDGLVSASSVVPSARVAALWEPAVEALPRHPSALLRLDREELSGVIDGIAERYGYLVL